jgi:hypothetical protein
MMGDANVVTGCEDFITRLEPGIAACGNPPGQIDASDAGETPDDPPGASRGQCILVVDARVGNGNRHFARVELSFVHGDEPTLGFVVFLSDQIRFEGHARFLLFRPVGPVVCLFS